MGEDLAQELGVEVGQGPGVDVLPGEGEALGIGVADAGLLEELVDAVDAGDARRALLALERCVQDGRDAGSFASDLEVHARELLVVQTLGELPAELSLTEEADARLRAQAERVDRAVVVRLLELLGEALEGVRAGADPRTRLELALVKAASPAIDAGIQALTGDPYGNFPAPASVWPSSRRESNAWAAGWVWNPTPARAAAFGSNCASSERLLPFNW